MKVAYVYPPLFKPFYPMATRIMTENLLRNKNLDVQFSHIPVKTYSSNTDKALYDGFMEKAASRFSSNVVSFLEQKYMVYNVFYVFMAHGYYDAFIVEDFEADHVIFTCINYCDLLIVRNLLENGKRVVLGGPLVNIGLSPDFFRRLLYGMGIEKSKLQDNLIIISGNVDLSTDLYQIIRNWKDGRITRNDYGSVYECRGDFLQPHYQGKTDIPVHLGFNNWCWYGKCKFCTYKELPRMDFLKDLESQSTVQAIHEIMQGFNSRHIRFIDSYYRPHSPVVQEILKEISQYHITIFTGITLLKDKQYIEFVNKYVNCLLIGLESTSDFTLKHVAKGYRYRDIELAVRNMIQYLDRDIFLEISVILDLPYRDAEDVQDNYRRIAALKDRLDGAGFRVAVHMNILSVFPNLELLYTEDAMLKRSFDSNEIASSTGKNYLIHVLKESGMDRPSQLPASTVLVDEDNAYGLRYGYISSNVPVIRQDVNGKILLSDLELMDEDVMKRILLRKSRFEKKAVDG
ncbi:MAG: hypothetical protein K9N10_13265 [Deltaproteobacteria bacterium]|nr:hypothetical protein [Deltaproteobacteria bacterium]